VTLSTVKNLGYWIVQGKEYNNKVLAVLAAQEAGLELSDITFHYNDQWWDTVDWTVEPKESLDDLYLRRARQLREKYDTLILRYSGGADSTNILRTFLDNGLKIDVVSINMWTPEGLDPWLQPSNVEKRDLAIPYIEELKKQGADFEVVINDFSPTLDVIRDQPNWPLKIDAPRLTIVDLCLNRALTTPEYDKWNNPSTAVIVGVDKPQVWCQSGKIWSFSLCDNLHPIHYQTNQMCQEPFYWTADLPEIPVKQGHVLKNYYRDRQERLIAIPGTNKFGIFAKRALIPLIYPKYFGYIEPSNGPLPYYDMSEVSAKVKKENTNAPRGTGIDFGFEQSPYYPTWKQGIDLVDRLIDRRFKNKDTILENGIVPLYTKPRWLGK
jgi:hypothetical protein